MWMAERWKTFGWVFVAIMTIGGAIVVLPKATEVVEPGMPVLKYQAKRDYAPAKDYAATQAIVVNQQINDLTGRLSRLKTDKGGWSVQLERERSGRARPLIEAQIERIDHEIAATEEQLKKLKIQ